MAAQLQAGSAVADFRARLAPYEDQRATLARADARLAWRSSLWMVASGVIVALFLPSPQWLSSWDITYSADWAIGPVAALLLALALPFAAIGAVGLALDALMARRGQRLPIVCHWACAAQSLIALVPAVVALALFITIFWFFIVVTPIALGLFFAD